MFALLVAPSAAQDNQVAQRAKSHPDFGDRASMLGHEKAWPEILAHLDRYLADKG